MKGLAPRYEPASPREHGAVYTPEWIVRRVVEMTLAPLVQGRDPASILALRVLDPACGDGAFLRAAHDFLAARAVPAELYGLDIDPLAVDAARARCPEARLGCGNFLTDEAEPGSFDAVVGNPPYIEVKRYKAWLPALHQYLRQSGRFETMRRGKADAALAFLEHGLRMLRPGGRLGFIISNRFFRAAYGRAAREWLSAERALAEVEDFGDLQVFPGRTTYTAIVILERGQPRFRYRSYPSLARARAGIAGVERELDASAAGGTWAFDQPELMAVRDELAARHRTIGDHRRLQIAVGVQTLYGKLYQLAPVAADGAMVTGKNGQGETVTLERAALRPLCMNRGFRPFRPNNADAWIIFPYKIMDGRAAEIGWREFAIAFPRAARYLKEHQDELLQAVATEPGPERWHLYTRPQNLAVQARPKVLFPMTITDTVATVDFRGEVYQDNVNVNSISFAGASSAQLLAIAAVFNSTLFNALARLQAGLNNGGWRKFNRQFAALVPFPAAVFDDPGTVAALASSAGELSERIAAGDDRTALAALWGRLDAAVEQVYGLTAAQKKILAQYPRRVDRCESCFSRRGGSQTRPAGRSNDTGSPTDGRV